MPSKEQHFFARMFLKGFTNSQGQIYFLNVKKKKIELRNPKSVAKKRDLYTVYSERKDYTVEEKFSDIESNASPVFVKLLAEGFGGLSDEDILIIIDFAVLTLNRVPLSTEISEEVIRDELVQNNMRSIHPENGQKYIDECLAQKGRSYAVTLAPNFIHRHKIITENFDAYLFTSEEGSEPFILHDGYMCLEMRSAEVFYKNEGKDVDWGRMNVVKHFPLSSTHCISFFNKQEVSRKGTNQMAFTKQTMSHQDVRAVNQMALKYMREYAYSADIKRFEQYLESKYLSAI